MSLASRKKTVINRGLAMNGLATMDDPRGLLDQIAFLCKDHEAFRNLLMRVEPEKRYSAYHSLKTRLRFEARSLDAYIAEAKQEAVNQNLPEWDNETKLLKDPGSHAAEAACSRAVAAAVADSEKLGRMTLTCRKCTRNEVFRAVNKKAAWQSAHEAGWKSERIAGEPKALCPQCSGHVQ